MRKESLQEKLNRMLKNYDVVNFTYIKKNGETRHARGTKKIDAIEKVDENAIPKGTGTPKVGIISYFDLDKEAWRSVRDDAIVSIETQEPLNLNLL